MKLLNQQLRKELERVEDLLDYLELMAAILPNFDYWKMLGVAENTRQFLRVSNDYELAQNLHKIKELTENQAESLMKDCPPKLSIAQIAEKFRTLRDREDIINTGVTFSFLNELMDLSRFNWYADTPYHYRIAVGPLKGGGGIEEEFLLKDAFAMLKRAEFNFELLTRAAVVFRTREHPDASIHRYITDIKYDVANYSRQSVLTFFSFIECLINSIGFDYLFRHEKALSHENILILKGLKKNGGYMSLKHRVESLQAVIRVDKKIVLKLADEQQRKEPFISFFNRFEALRNASVHYSPMKHMIWRSPNDWINQAREFCDIALAVGTEIWKACYPESEGPLYLGKLNKAKQLSLADGRIEAAKALTNLIAQDKNNSD